MKRFFYIAAVLMLGACGRELKTKSDGKYGEEFAAGRFITVAQVMQQMQNKEQMDVVVSGTVSGVCKNEGCWLTLDNPGGEELFIDVKDKSFHLSADIEGKTAFVKGSVTKTLVSVQEQKEDAKEAGMTQQEIDAISQPSEEITMEATGVIIK